MRESQDILSGRRTEEVVIAFVGPVGAGVTTTARLLGEILTNQFAYAVSYYRVSELIEESAGLVRQKSAALPQGAERIGRLQDLGNRLRSQFGAAFLAERCIERIAIERLEGGYKKVEDNLVPTARRHAHIIDSVKNPAEVSLFRDVYGDMFWLVAVSAPEQTRKTRLLSSGIERSCLDTLIDRDENERLGHGQNVRDTTQLADFFIRNDGMNDQRLRTSLNRYLDVLFNIGVHTPTVAESAMYHAVSAASKSACLSRQVGASLYSEEGELISVGWNDVPRFGGGLYGVEAGTEDHRCYLWDGKLCHNDLHKRQLYNQVGKEVRKFLVEKDAKIADFLDDAFPEMIEMLAATEIRNLIEFSRSVHAEMEAILAAARRGATTLVGATMYVTTFPCHNCARHIVASGVKQVIYIEPYPKSLALRLHSDAISVSDSDLGRRVVFLQYEGVAPKNIVRLFKHGEGRKEAGQLVVRERRDAQPVFQPAMDGFAVHEQMIVDGLKRKLGRAGTVADEGGAESGENGEDVRATEVHDAADRGQPQLFAPTGTSGDS